MMGQNSEGLTGAQYVAQDFDIQYWTGSAWATTPGGVVTGNNKIVRTVAFSAPVDTQKIRYLIKRTPDPLSHVTEIEAYDTSAVP